ncbi:MAG: TIGR02757 family protein [Nitrospinota bacterium]
MDEVRLALDKLVGEMNSRERILNDPILFPHRFSKKTDIEVAGFIASSLAYGKVELFLPVLEAVFSVMGNSPSHFCLAFDPKRDAEKFDGMYYRFTTGRDIASMLLFIGKALKDAGSLSNLFLRYFCNQNADVREGTTGFLNYFRSLNRYPVSEETKWSHGLTHLFPSPSGASALKRFNLFLRWMVREGGVDFGIWDRVPPSKLIIPLDTHVLRVGNQLGLTERKSANMGTALEITSALSKLDPEDPVKYDFALCHFGISGKCPKAPVKTHCSTCVLWSICKRS